MKVEIIVPPERQGELFARAQQLALEGWAESANDAIKSLMEEFMEGWYPLQIEIQLPLGDFVTSHRATLIMTDGREKIRLKGEGDSPYGALLGALVDGYVSDSG